MAETSLQELVQAQRRYFDNTILTSYRECPRRYFLRHVKNWRREGIGLPLVFGLAWHSAMDVVWQHYHKVSKSELLDLAGVAFDATWEEEGLPIEMNMEQIEQYTPRTPMVAREMLAAYIEKREDILKNSKLLAAEQPFAVPLPFDSRAPSSTWYAGRLDKVVEYNGGTLPLEHKTTSEYRKDGGFKPTYVEGWYLDSQIMGYLYGGGLYYENVQQVWVDAALVHKQVHNAFRFIPVGHQWGMLEAWVEDTKEWVARIYMDEERFARVGELKGGIFPKQQASCQGKYGPCQFLDICRTIADPSKVQEPPAGYILEAWEPFEILKLERLMEKPA